MGGINDFLSSLSSLLQILLIFAALAVGLFLARRWRIRRLRKQVRGELPLTEEVKKTVAKLFQSDVLEVATLGAVTYLDVAWQYTLADPQIWTHLDGAVANQAFDAMVDPHVLEVGLGEHAQPVLSHVADYIRHAEALQAFDHSLDNVMRFGVDLPNAVVLLDGHPDPLFDLLQHKSNGADGLDAKTQVLSDGAPAAFVDAKVSGVVEAKTSALADAKASSLADAKASVLVDAKASTLVDAKTGSLLDAKTSALIDAKTGSILDGAWNGSDLWHYVPVVTIGFASYRAWRRAEGGTRWGRNLEFAATEVITRSGGALAGAKVGGTVGTLVVPGYGTIIGSVVGAVGGAVAGARLGEEIKRRHLRKAQRDLDQALHNLGAPHLQDPVGYRRLQAAFAEQEKVARQNVQRTRGTYNDYARWWRRLWPDQKLILLQETVREADDRLLSVHQQIHDTLERVEVLKQQNSYKALGLILWNAPGMCQRLGCQEVLMQGVEHANEQLRSELVQVGVSPA
jgi:surface antigen